jgi:hypothetical protein
MAGGHEERHGRSSNTTDVGGLTQISPKKPRPSSPTPTIDAVGKPVAARSRPFDSGLSARKKKGCVRVFVLAIQRAMEGEDNFVA